MTKSDEMQSVFYIHQILKGTKGHMAQSNKIEVKYLLHQKKKKYFRTPTQQICVCIGLYLDVVHLCPHELNSFLISSKGEHSYIAELVPL